MLLQVLYNRIQGIFILSLILFLLSPSRGWTQTCCSGGVPISTNLGLPPSLKGTWQFALTYDLNFLNTLKEGTTVIRDDSRVRKTHSLILSAGYAVSDRISIEGLVPYVRQERQISQPGGFEDFEYTQGIGDVLLLLKYRLTGPANQNHILSIGAGPKFATGSSDQLNSQGLILNLDLQPGSGATDLIFWSNYIFTGFVRPSTNLYGVFTYRMTGVNHTYFGSSSYEIGNNLRILGGISDQFVVGSSILNTSLGLRYRRAQQDAFLDSPLPSTGGEWLFMIPGIGIQMVPDLSLEANIELPVIANPTGTQLTPTYRINLALSYVIDRTDL